MRGSVCLVRRIFFVFREGDLHVFVLSGMSVFFLLGGGISLFLEGGHFPGE